MSHVFNRFNESHIPLRFCSKLEQRSDFPFFLPLIRYSITLHSSSRSAMCTKELKVKQEKIQTLLIVLKIYFLHLVFQIYFFAKLRQDLIQPNRLSGILMHVVLPSAA